MAGTSRKAGKLAKMRKQEIIDPRPEEYFTKFHDLIRSGPPKWVYRLVRRILLPYVGLLFRPRGYGMENIPGDGPVLLAPNHFSYMDHFLVGKYVWPRKVQFLGKSQIFKKPLEWIYSYGGVIPVRRSQKDLEAPISVKAVLRRAGTVQVYIQGGRDRDGEVKGPVYPGLGRYHLETGVPIVPVAVYGSAQVRNWKRLQFPSVSIIFSEPLRWEPVENPTKEECQKVVETVFVQIKALYVYLEKNAARLRRENRWWRRLGRKLYV